MVEVLHDLFEADSNQQPKHDRLNMNKKLFPASGRMVRWVDVKHGALLLMDRVI